MTACFDHYRKYTGKRKYDYRNYRKNANTISAIAANTISAITANTISAIAANTISTIAANAITANMTQ